MSELAREIGVSLRQLRRWKNEGAKPKESTREGAARVKRLTRASGKAEGATRRELEADRRKHPKSIRITKRDLPVMPAGHRRELKRYAVIKGRARPTGETYESPWINYNVQGWSFREIAALVRQVWKAKHPFQFIYEVPAGGSLPKSGDKPERRVRKTTRAGTAPINPYAFASEAELLDFLNRYIDYEQGALSRRMVYIAVDDNRMQPGESDDEEE